MQKRLKQVPSARKLIYDYVAMHQTVSKAELLENFALTSSSLTRLLDEMTQEGLLQESGFGDSTGGRRPILYRINPAYGFVFGLEISRIYSSLGLFDMEMNPLSFIRWRMDEAMNPDNFIEHVANNIRSFMRDHRLCKEQIIGIGIGAVGPLDRENGVILEPLYFPAQGWNNVPICSLIGQATGLPAFLENGANTALLGEHRALGDKQIKHMLYVHAGAGLRSAMMTNGQIVYGAVDMEGSIGQMIIQTDGPRLQDDGNYGALEAFVSVQALEKQFQAQIKEGQAGKLAPIHMPTEQIKFDRLLAALHKGEPDVQKLFVQAATYFGIGLANLINVLHPEKIILGGALIASHDLFFATATTVARRNTYYYPQYEPLFSKGVLKEDAVATGAAAFLLKELSI
ncbi:ROK family protein [Paenibacillaceae bacterium]|nr:ROK family protein [Paenibacillaceae bacterium]